MIKLGITEQVQSKNMSNFEYDENKSQTNLAKHGIDFIKAQQLWEDANLLEFPARKVEDEERFFAIGIINQKYWTAVITYRTDIIRIVSVRRSRTEEIKVYESRRI
ncbi:conserved hypothetical protein [Microcystis aeruginosa PCC 9443]|jgi:uncharacterized DUF497 family protein|uniref:BrnT family toxin n=2 Tax=Microcystaceae TaxID=1890449 RepID=I4FYB9_MICAE|nr:conserved hypothetical protein [Microcystis aeruginosa PCC 9443]